MFDSSIIDSISTGICILDQNFVVLVWNSIMEDYTGLSGSDVFGKSISDNFPRFADESIRMRLEMVCTSGTPIVFSSLLHRDLFLKDKIHEFSPFYDIIVTSYQLESGLNTLLFTVKDVTELNHQILRFREMRDKALEEVEKRKVIEEELRDVNQVLEKMASTDPLTGLSNRRNISDRINVELIRNNRHKGTLSLILSDIDYFKKFNDTYGHDCGDYVLQKIASLMKDNLRAIDSASRWGGEEFLILLPETHGDNAVKVAEKIRQLLSEFRFIYEGQELKVTMTFGVAEQHSDEKQLLDIVKRADLALYQGKEQGRNRVIFETDIQ